MRRTRVRIHRWFLVFSRGGEIARLPSRGIVLRDAGGNTAGIAGDLAHAARIVGSVTTTNTAPVPDPADEHGDTSVRAHRFRVRFRTDPMRHALFTTERAATVDVFVHPNVVVCVHLEPVMGVEPTDSSLPWKPPSTRSPPACSLPSQTVPLPRGAPAGPRRDMPHRCLTLSRQALPGGSLTQPSGADPDWPRQDGSLTRNRTGQPSFGGTVEGPLLRECSRAEQYLTWACERLALPNRARPDQDRPRPECERSKWRSCTTWWEQRWRSLP